MTTDESGKITYTIREMFTDIKNDLKRIDDKLENKADRAVVEGLSRDMLEIKAERKAEREMGLQMVAEYRVLQGEHAQLKTDVSVLKSGKRDFVIYGGLFVTFAGMVTSLVYTIHQLVH